MRKFIILSILFIGFPAVYFSINYFVNFKIIENNPPVIQNSLIIIGDSHVQKAINPALLNDAKNIAQPAESYYMTFWKLKKIFETNTSIHTVVLGFSYHNISAFNDKKLLDPEWSSATLKRIYTFFKFEKSGIEIDYMNFYRTVLFNMCLYPNHKFIHYIGDYSNSNYSNVNNYEKSIKRHFFYKLQNAGISKISLSYLDSIFKLKKVYGFELFLVSTPLHKNYRNNIPGNFQKSFDKCRDSLINNKINILNYTNLDFADSLFLDSDHLNAKGAKVFTPILKKSFNKK